MRFPFSFKKSSYTDTKTTNLPPQFGVTGLRHRHGVLNEEFLPALRGQQGRKIYTEMRDNDPTIGALLNALELLLRTIEWRVAPSPQDINGEKALWVENQINHLQTPWREVVAEMCSAFVFGFALFEKNLSHDANGHIILHDLAPRAQETIEKWEFDSNGRWTEAHQRDPLTGKILTLPRNRLLWVCPKAVRQNPEGRSLLRNAYTAYYHIKRLQTIEAIAIERELNGVPVVLAPAAALKDPATKETLDKIARDLKFNEQGGVVIPSDPFMDREGSYSTLRQFDIKLLASDGTRSIDTTTVITRYQSDMLRAVLADFLMLGSMAQGSYALADNKSALFMHSLEAFAQHIADILRRDVLTELWTLNGFDPATLPHFVAGTIRPVDLTTLGNYIQALGDVGIDLSDLQTVNMLRNAAKLPHSTTGE